ncbi:MAG: potassium channel family protein [Actinomycetia bacterium]|nr:potassium channel family protein [Actinomycetes bacterium]
MRDRLRRNPRQVVGLAAVGVTTLVGAAWYWLVEGFGLLDALYQSVITVSTVGFTEVHELDRSGRAFTIVLIVTGVAAVVFSMGAFAGALVESSIRRITQRRRERNVGRLSGHLVICGYGRTGAMVADLIPPGMQAVAIDRYRQQVDAATDRGHIGIEGNCTSDEILIEAGIERASTLIVAVASDSDALSTVLSARVLNPRLRIVSRVEERDSTKKLRLAGADHVVSPLEMGAQRLVADMLQPSVGSFLDAALHDTSIGYSMQALPLPGDGGAIDVPQVEAITGARIIGVMDAEGHIVEASHTSDDVQPGHTILAVGRDSELLALARYLADRHRSRS